MDRRLGCLMLNIRAECFPALVWPQIVCPQQVVEECEGSGVGAQLLDLGLSKLCHPGDCLLGLQNHVGKRKQCGKFVLPGLMTGQAICYLKCMGCAGVFASCSAA